MTAPLPAEVRDEIVRLRGERLTYKEIASIVGVLPSAVQAICKSHYGDQVRRAAEALRREINLARAEAHTAPLFHPVDWT